MNELFFITKHQLISWLRNLGMLMKFGSLDSEGGKLAVLILYFFNKKSYTAELELHCSVLKATA